MSVVAAMEVDTAVVMGTAEVTDTGLDTAEVVTDTAPGTGGAGGGGNWGGHHGHGPGLRFYGYPFVGYGAYYDRGGYGEGCGWLRRRAQATGSRYWWARYEECVDDNY